MVSAFAPSFFVFYWLFVNRFCQKVWFCCPDTQINLQNDHFCICRLYLWSQKTHMRVSVSVLQIICLRMQMLKKTPIYCHCSPSSTVLHTTSARDNIPAPLFCHSVSTAVASATVAAVSAIATTASSAIAAAIATAIVIFIRRLSPLPPPTAVATAANHRCMLLIACPHCCRPPPLSLLLLPPPLPPLFLSPSVTASTSASINAAFTCRLGSSSREWWQSAMVKSIVGRWSRWEVSILDYILLNR